SVLFIFHRGNHLKYTYFHSCVDFGFIIKRFAHWAWKPNDFLLQKRDAPPPCLVDSTFGRHSYLKLKGVKLHYVESGKKGSTSPVAAAWVPRLLAQLAPSDSSFVGSLQ
ncbi:hypothetical protein L9F63_019179, partial [Diploptera punctata]